MKSYEIDMCNGSLWKKMMSFSVPLMFSNILQVIFNMSDVAVVGRFAGASALGAVGSTTILITLFTGILIGISGGVNAIVALYLGAKNEKAVKQSVHTGIFVCLFFGLLITILGITFARPILKLMDTKEILLSQAVQYFQIYLIGIPFLALYNFGNAVLSAAGDTKRPLYYLSFAGIINIVLNLVFVIVLRLDVIGVGLASVIAQIISAMLIIVRLFRTDAAFGVRIKELKISRVRMVQILKIGVPSALQNSIFAVANIFVQRSVNSFDHIVVEGNSAAANADALIYDMMAAVYMAGTSFIAQNRGAGKKNRILKSYIICVIYSFGVGLILGVGLYIFRYQFLSLFTTESKVVDTGIKRLGIMAFSYCISAFMDGSIAALRGLGRSIGPTVVVILGSCVFRIVWICTVFAHFRTIESLYLLYSVSWTITGIAESLYFICVYRRLKCMPGD